MKRLVATADVFIQNFRPGVADRMGLGEDALRAVKPDLIYVSISGFGETGPYAGKPVYDPLVRVNAESVPEPWLVKSWKFNDAGTELTLSLQENVRFHSGREMKAADEPVRIDR